MMPTISPLPDLADCDRSDRRVMFYGAVLTILGLDLLAVALFLVTGAS